MMFFFNAKSLSSQSFAEISFAILCALCTSALNSSGCG